MLYIAYVENDERSRFTFEQIAVLLRARGFNNEVRYYASPEEALDKIPLERPDIVFIDMRLTNGHDTAGLELTRALRQHPLCRRTALVGMAEYAMPADRTAALAAGCDDFLAKPVRYQAVEEIVVEMANQHVFH